MERLRAATQSPVAPADERAAFVGWLSASYPLAYDRGEAERLWRLNHVAALSWQARARLADARTVSGYVCAECKAALRPGYTCDVCFSDEPYDGERQIPVYLEAPTVSATVPEAIRTMAQRIAADKFEHCTADPVFTVQKRALLSGLDLDYCEDIGWFHDSGLAMGKEAVALEAEYQDSGTVPDGYTRTGIMETWEHYATYITPESAQEFVSKKGDQYRVYVDSGCRNHEWKALRAFLKDVAAAPTPSTSAADAELVPTYVVNALKAWTGSEPSVSVLARAVDQWLDPAALWEHDRPDDPASTGAASAGGES